MAHCVSPIVLAVLPATFLAKSLSPFWYFLLYCFRLWRGPVRDWQSGIPADNVLAYEVFRNDKRIGFHHMQFTRNGGEVRVDIHIELDVGWALFRFLATPIKIPKYGAMVCCSRWSQKRIIMANPLSDLALKDGSYLGRGSRYEAVWRCRLCRPAISTRISCANKT